MRVFEEHGQDQEVKYGEVVNPVVRYPRIAEVPLPAAPTTQIRRSGGWFSTPNQQDVAHAQRMRDVYHLGREVAFIQEMAIATELHGIQAVTRAMQVAEEIVYSLPNGSVAAMVAADLAGEMAARARDRHGRLADAFDAEAMNILRRR